MLSVCVRAAQPGVAGISLRSIRRKSGACRRSDGGVRAPRTLLAGTGSVAARGTGVVGAHRCAAEARRSPVTMAPDTEEEEARSPLDFPQACPECA
eukprot:scaffold3767_cov242-Prasinococcus_capsulatus_cf.AAC.11